MLSALWQPLAATPVLIGWIWNLETKRIRKMAVWRQYGFRHYKRSGSTLQALCIVQWAPWPALVANPAFRRGCFAMAQSPKFGHVYTSTSSKPLKNHSKAGIMWWLPVANMDYDQNHQIYDGQTFVLKKCEWEVQSLGWFLLGSMHRTISPGCSLSMNLSNQKQVFKKYCNWAVE